MNKKINFTDKQKRYINLTIRCIAALIYAYIFSIFWSGSLYKVNGDISMPRIVVCTITFVIAEALLFIKVKLKKGLNIILSIVLSLAIIIENFMILEYSQGYDWSRLDFKKTVLNLVIICIIFVVIYAITNSFKGAIIGMSAITTIFGITNFFVTIFRGTAILAVDFYSASTAGNVAGNYHYNLNYECYIMLFTSIAICILCTKLDKNIITKGKYRIIPALLAVVMLAGGYFTFIKYSGFDKELKIKMYKPQESYSKYGMYLTFIHSIKYLAVEKPQGYSIDAVKDITKQYLDGDEKSNGKNPNIIVIMDEGLTDFEAIGNVGMNKDNMPFYHSLVQNTVKGQVFVSVFGGGTANTEFEVLTGNSTAFVPRGSSPYVSYVTREMPSLATILERQNYGGMIAMHPFKGSGYRRNKVYPLLGFDRFITRDDFKNDASQKMRNFISDKANFGRIISEYEQYKKSNDNPFFLFNVTMQNHSGFDEFWDNMTDEIELTGDEQQTDTRVFLNLIKETDNALKELISYFESVNEPTIVVVFGDHQPRISSEFYKKMKSTYKLGDEYLKLYKYSTPFMIWANYDIEEQDDVMISANYLNWLIADVAGVNKSGYQRFIGDIYKEIPVLTSKGYVGNDGKYYSLDKKNTPYADAINKYEIIEYNNIFDRKNRAEDFFK